MKLLLGIGNTGPKYEHTRHNAGIMFVSFLSRNPVKNLMVKKTISFMNSSGPVVKKMLQHHNLTAEDLIIAHDDLDIKLGEFKIQKSKGPKDHKGLISITNAINSRNFLRIRIGIDNRPKENRTEGDEYVLSNFTDHERQTLEASFVKIKNELEKII